MIVVRVRKAGLALVVIALVALTGCTSQKSASESATPAAHGHSPSSSAAPVAPVAQPGPRVAISCAQLLSPAAVGYTGTTAPTSGYSLADAHLGLGSTITASAMQDGVQHCVWDNGTDEPQSGPTAVVTVLLDHTDAARDTISQMLSSGSASLGLGDTSAGACYDDPFECGAQVAMGSVWFYVGFVGQPTGSQLSPAQATAMLGTAASSVATVLNESSQSPAWKPGRTTWQAGSDCGALGATAALTQQLGAGAWIAGNGVGDEDTPLTTALNEDRLNCAWNSSATRSDGSSPTFSLDVVVGGAWVWPYLGKSADTTSIPIQVPGATQAAYRCQKVDTSTYCWADAIADDSWVQLMFNYGADATQARTTAALEAVLAAHQASS